MSKNYQIIDSVGLVRGEYATLASAEKAIRKLGRKIPHGVFSILEERQGCKNGPRGILTLESDQNAC